MKKLILAAVIALSVTGAANAQSHKDSTQAHSPKVKKGDKNKGDKGNGKAASFKHVDKLKTDLNLSDDQVKKLKAQQAQTDEKVKSIEANTSLDAAAKKKQIHDLKKQNKDNMKSVLTPEQKEKMKSLDKQHKDKGAE